MLALSEEWHSTRIKLEFVPSALPNLHYVPFPVLSCIILKFNMPNLWWMLENKTATYKN